MLNLTNTQPSFSLDMHSEFTDSRDSFKAVRLLKYEEYFSGTTIRTISKKQIKVIVVCTFYYLILLPNLSSLVMLFIFVMSSIWTSSLQRGHEF